MLSVNALVLWARNHRAHVVAAAVIVAVASAWGIARLRFDTDVLSLLPRQVETIVAFRSYLERFGAFDRLFVVFTAPNDHSVTEYAEAIDRWAAAVAEAPEVVSVDTGLPDPARDWQWFADRQLLLLGDARLQEALSRFHAKSMREALARSRLLLATPSSEVAAMVRQDPLGLLELVRDEFAGAQPGVSLRPDGYVSPDGRRRLVIVRPASPPFDTTFSAALLDRIERVNRRMTRAPQSDIDDEPLPPLQIELAGGHRIAIETEEVVRREAIGNTVGSLLLILPLLLLVFRSAWLVAFGALPAALAILVVLGVYGMTGHTLSAAAAGSAAMMFGLGVDGVVLLYAASANAGHPSGGAGRHCRLGSAASSMLLGMWTTAATFYGLALVDFPTLAELGILVGHGMALCGVFTLLLVPALLPRKASCRPRPILMPRFAAFVVTRRRPLLAAAALVTVVLGVVASTVKFDPTLDRLRSATEGAAAEREIRRAFGLPDEFLLVLTEGDDLELLLQRNERLRRDLTRQFAGLAVHAPSALLPSASRQRAVHQRVGEALPAHATLVESLDAAGRETGFKPGALQPFAERLARLTDAGTTITLDGYQQHGLGELLQPLVARSGATWMLATYLYPDAAATIGRLASAVAAADPEAQVTGLPLVNQELAVAFVPQFVQGLVLGSIAVVVMIVVTFRDWRLAALTLLPTVIGLVWAAGLLAMAGATLDLFSMFAVVSFIGIGVDYGIHLVHRFRECGSSELALAELAPVVMTAGAITLAGYGMLATSTYAPLRSMGAVSIASVVALVTTSLFVLPPLLGAGHVGQR